MYSHNGKMYTTIPIIIIIDKRVYRVCYKFIKTHVMLIHFLFSSYTWLNTVDKTTTLTNKLYECNIIIV